MAAEVKLTSLGFVVLDDFGPEGRRPVMGGTSPNGPGVLVFAARHAAQEYAAARDRHREHFEQHGYAGDEYELREECKRITREHARIFDETPELAGLVEPLAA